MPTRQFVPLGDTGVIVKLGNGIDPKTHEHVKMLADYLQSHPFPGLVELVPAFTTVTVYYDPIRLYDASNGQMPYDRVVAFLEQALSGLSAADVKAPRIVEIPVCYGDEFGPDLEEVARHNRLTPEEVISIHTSVQYLVYMIGFAPGFPYLGGMDSRIATPRRSSPRLSLPEGSVGIGGKQTGVYPIESPGGWQIIGRTPEKLFRPENNPPSLLQAGDMVRFRAITPSEYEKEKKVTP